MTKESDDDDTLEQLTKLGGENHLYQDILQSVHDKEKDEMERINEEKHQLNDCLDTMASELANLRNSINNQDPQQNPHNVLDESQALEKMLSAIELGHNRAEQLESKIGILQRQIEKETAMDANNSIQMQNACQALQDHRAQLVEKSNRIDSFAQALRNITDKIGGAEVSEDSLSDAFKIAEQLRIRMQECDEVIGDVCQSHEVDLAKVQSDLDDFATECNFTETLESQEAHIKELEEKLFAKDREVEATQRQLQTLERAIDANKERARKLESELQAMTAQLWQIAGVKQRHCRIQISSNDVHCEASSVEVYAYAH